MFNLILYHIGLRRMCEANWRTLRMCPGRGRRRDLTWKPDSIRVQRDLLGARTMRGDEQGAIREIGELPGKGRMGAEPIIIVSNRGPVNFERDEQTGALVGRPGAGGVVS